MLEELDPSLEDADRDLIPRWAAAQPFRHLVFERFLNPAFCRELIAEFPAFDEKAARNETGGVGRKAVVSKLAGIGPAYARFDRLMKDREFLDWMGRVTGIPNLLYDREYAGGGTHENLSGQELDTHVDFNYHPATRLHRRLNLILFLNPEWDPGWGGCLELVRDPFSSDAGNALAVMPLANRAVLFETTEASWHGFRRIRIPEGRNTSRRSIAVYFYTKERPAAETAPPHATVYYQRPLPERMQAGYTLDAEDVEELRTLIGRRDGYLKFLYAREKEIQNHVMALSRSPSYRLGLTLTWPARKLRSMLGR